jgi:hypothetical protein
MYNEVGTIGSEVLSFDLQNSCNDSDNVNITMCKYVSQGIVFLTCKMCSKLQLMKGSSVMWLEAVSLFWERKLAHVMRVFFQHQ